MSEISKGYDYSDKTYGRIQFNFWNVELTERQTGRMMDDKKDNNAIKLNW